MLEQSPPDRARGKSIRFQGVAAPIESQYLGRASQDRPAADESPREYFGNTASV
jgi:hypothetical protein